MYSYIALLGQFFKTLFNRFVDTKSMHCRLDLIAVGSQASPFLTQLQKILGMKKHLLVSACF